MKGITIVLGLLVVAAATAQENPFDFVPYSTEEAPSEGEQAREPTSTLRPDNEIRAPAPRRLAGGATMTTSGNTFDVTMDYGSSAGVNGAWTSAVGDQSNYLQVFRFDPVTSTRSPVSVTVTIDEPAGTITASGTFQAGDDQLDFESEHYDASKTWTAISTDGDLPTITVVREALFFEISAPNQADTSSFSATYGFPNGSPGSLTLQYTHPVDGTVNVDTIALLPQPVVNTGGTTTVPNTGGATTRTTVDINWPMSAVDRSVTLLVEDSSGNLLKTVSLSPYFTIDSITDDGTTIGVTFSATAGHDITMNLQSLNPSSGLFEPLPCSGMAQATAGSSTSLSNCAYPTNGYSDPNDAKGIALYAEMQTTSGPLLNSHVTPFLIRSPKIVRWTSLVEDGTTSGKKVTVEFTPAGNTLYGYDGGYSAVELFLDGTPLNLPTTVDTETNTFKVVSDNTASGRVTFRLDEFADGLFRDQSMFPSKISGEVVYEPQSGVVTSTNKVVSQTVSSGQTISQTTGELDLSISFSGDTSKYLRSCLAVA